MADKAEALQKLIQLLGDNPSDEHLTNLYRHLVINSFQVSNGVIRVQPTETLETLEKEPGKPWVLKNGEI